MLGLDVLNALTPLGKRFMDRQMYDRKTEKQPKLFRHKVGDNPSKLCLQWWGEQEGEEPGVSEDRQFLFPVFFAWERLRQLAKLLKIPPDEALEIIAPGEWEVWWVGQLGTFPADLFPIELGGNPDTQTVLIQPTVYSGFFLPAQTATLLLGTPLTRYVPCSWLHPTAKIARRVAAQAVAKTK